MPIPQSAPRYTFGQTLWRMERTGSNWTLIATRPVYDVNGIAVDELYCAGHLRHLDQMRSPEPSIETMVAHIEASMGMTMFRLLTGRPRLSDRWEKIREKLT